MPKSPKPDSAIINVRVVPRSSQNRIEVVDSNSLKVWISAPPIDGEANEAVCALLAKSLSLPKSAICVITGATGRTKKIQITGCALDETFARLSPGKTAG